MTFDADPLSFVITKQRRLQELSRELREDIARMEDAEARSMFETAAAQLDALAQTFHYYRHEAEPTGRGHTEG